MANLYNSFTDEWIKMCYPIEYYSAIIKRKKSCYTLKRGWTSRTLWWIKLSGHRRTNTAWLYLHEVSNSQRLKQKVKWWLSGAGRGEYVRCSVSAKFQTRWKLLEICAYSFLWYSTLKNLLRGHPCWSSGLESALQCWGYWFHPWSGKIPHASGQLSRCIRMAHQESLKQEKAPHQERSPPLEETRKSWHLATKTTQRNQK